MSIQIQRRYRRPTSVKEWFARVAPKGLNTNTQFFLVFLAVLGLHLWLAPAFMSAAADPEPGEPQRYLTSDGTPADTKSLDSRGPSDAAERERLILADGEAKREAAGSGTAAPSEKSALPTPAVPVAPPAETPKPAAPAPVAENKPVAGPEPRIADLIPAKPAEPAKTAVKDPIPAPKVPALRAEPTVVAPKADAPGVEDAPATVRKFRTLP